MAIIGRAQQRGGPAVASSAGDNGVADDRMPGDSGDPDMDGDNDTSMQGDTDQDAGGPDPNDPSQAIGYIDPSLPAKVRAFLEAAKTMVMTPQFAQALMGAVNHAGDIAKGVAPLIETMIQKLEEKLGPLTDDEHDKVAFFIAGWCVSSLQKAGAPGLDSPAGRQDLLGRILNQVDTMTQGDGGEPQGQPMNGQPPPDGAAPMGQFAPGGQ